MTLDSEKIVQLSDLCRLWGVIKHFHPFLAYQDINWDSALETAIETVCQPASSFEAAIKEMLECLGDPATRIQDITLTELDFDTEDAIATVELETIEPGIGLISATRWSALTQEYAINPYAQPAIFREALLQGRNQRAIIFDLRRAASDSTDIDSHRAIIPFCLALIEDIKLCISRPVIVPSTRKRVSRGMRGQTVWNQFMPGFLVGEHQVLEPALDTTHQPELIFIINEFSAGISGVLGGLQAAGLGKVICEGPILPPAETDPETHLLNLTNNISVSVRLDELVHIDGSVGLSPDRFVTPKPECDMALSEALTLSKGEVRLLKPQRKASPPIQQTPPATNEQGLPIQSRRLAVLFQFWNKLKFLSPHRDYFVDSLDEILPAFIKAFANTETESDYVRELARLVAQTPDPRAFVIGEAYDREFGNTLPPVHLLFGENNAVLISRIDDLDTVVTGTLLPGDEILNVNGKDIGEVMAALMPYAPGPDAFSKARFCKGRILAGSREALLELTVRRHDGSEHQCNIRRTLPLDPFLLHFSMTPTLEPVDRVGDRYGYLDLARIHATQLRGAIANIQDTEGLVLDARSGSEAIYPLLLPHFNAAKTLTTIHRSPIGLSPQPGELAYTENRIYSAPGRKIYDRPIAILINEETSPRAEHAMMQLKVAEPDRVTYVGTRTLGFFGGAQTAPLSGGISASIASVEVLFPDNSPLAGHGLTPDIAVQPSPDGLANGRDEALERAIDYLTERSKLDDPTSGFTRNAEPPFRP